MLAGAAVLPHRLFVRCTQRDGQRRLGFVEPMRQLAEETLAHGSKTDGSPRNAAKFSDRPEDLRLAPATFKLQCSGRLVELFEQLAGYASRAASGHHRSD